MMFKSLTKKITAGITAAALGFSLTFSAPAVAEASGADVAVGIGAAILQASLARNEVKKQIKVINDTEEGREALYQKFREEYGVNTDYEFNALLDRIMSNLTNAVGQVDSKIYEKPYKYFVSNQQEVNAACSMGHVMMVNVGLLKSIYSEDEIAAVVGHEMGHGQGDHVAKSINKNITKQMIAGVAVAAAGGNSLSNIAGQFLFATSVAHGSRKFESEADNLAWEYMLHTNYNPGACAAMMQKLWELSKGAKGNFLSSHPDTDKRRDNYVKKLYEYSGKHVDAKDGVISINGKTFTTVAATSKMSSPERSYMVMGNLAKAYHNGKTYSAATVSNGTIYLDDMAIMTPAEGDEDAYTLAERLNELINTPLPAKDKKSKDKKSDKKDKKSYSKKAA